MKYSKRRTTIKSNEVDLHIHSIYSDGGLKPNELLEIALVKGLRCIAIADHNTIDGAKELIEIVKDKKLTVISGVELDTVYDDNNYHILGYDFYKKHGLIEMNKKFPSIKETCEKIHKAGGIAVLAHPRKTIKINFKTELEKIIKSKIDGIECYYPSHSEEIVGICLNMCEQHNLFITAGSDFHRKSGSREIGKNNIMIGNIFTRW